MRLSKILLVLLVIGTPAALQAGRVQPLQEPHIYVDVTLEDDELKAIIKRALVGRGWQVLSAKDGVVYARLLIRSHTADIRIAYNDRGIDLRYIDSVNLKYRIRGNGMPYIHRNYNHWVNNIKRDIMVDLGSYR